MKSVWLAAAIQIVLTGTALPQPSQPASAGAVGQPSSPADEEVVVTAPNVANMRDFVRNITATPSSYGQAPLWNDALCYQLVGVGGDSAQRILDRLASNAGQLQLSVAAPGCTPNVVIAFANDVNAVVAEADQNRRRLMGVDGADNVSMGPGAWRDFIETPRPVRWWHVSRLVTRDNQRLGHSTLQANAGLHASGGGDMLGGTSVRDTGLLRRPTHLNMRQILIIVDTTRLSGVSATALADYLSMVSLAPIDPHADLGGTPTILNLFAGIGATEMTDWDRSYLRGLYESDPNNINPEQTVRDVANRMRRE